MSDRNSGSTCYRLIRVRHLRSCFKNVTNTGFPTASQSHENDGNRRHHSIVAPSPNSDNIEIVLLKPQTQAGDSSLGQPNRPRPQTFKIFKTSIANADMKRLLDVSRAARLAGIPTEEIQRLIAQGSLSASEGKVDMDQLSELFPEIEQRPMSMLEVVSQIKDDAVYKSGDEKTLDKASMRAEIKQLRTELAYYTGQVENFRRLLTDVQGSLCDLQEKVDQKQRVEAIIKWLQLKVKELS